MKFKEKVFVSIVVYLRDDNDKIESYLDKIGSYFYNKFEFLEFILVDDFSADSTFEKSQKLIEKMGINGSVIRLSYRHGKERAFLAGLDKSVGDYVWEFESVAIDYPLGKLKEMFDKLKEGFDIISLRPKHDVGFYKKIYYYLFNRFSFINDPIYSERVSLITRRALNSVLDISEKLRYNKVILAFGGYPKVSIDFNPINKDYIDKRSFLEKTNTAFEHFVSYSYIGSRVPLIFSFFFFLFSIIIGMYAIYSFVYKDIVRGWTSIICFLSFSFAGVFFILGITSEYITKILRETVNMPIYSIREISSNFEQGNIFIHKIREDDFR